MPDRSSRYLFDNNVFIAGVLRKWTKSMELIYRPLDSPVNVRRQGSRRAARKSPALGRGYPAPFVIKIIEVLKKIQNTIDWIYLLASAIASQSMRTSSKTLKSLITPEWLWGDK